MPGADWADAEVLLHKMGGGAFSSARGIRERRLHSPECRCGDVRSFHYPSGGPVPVEAKGARFVARAAAGTGQHDPQPKGLS